MITGEGLSMVKSLDARSGRAMADVRPETSPEELDRLCRKAAELAPVLAALSRRARAAMLASMAVALERRRPEVVALADRETALGEARLNGELTRSVYQLRFFGEVIEDGAYLEATVDHPRETQVGKQPDLRRFLRPLGPVAVFGASNFPLAFSVPGGDTASALAAGCPVIVKAHDAHPATSALCAEALAEGAADANVDPAVVSLVFGEAAGRALVQHPTIKAVGFTGSTKGGRYLFELASRRADPVPFYGELGAQNPVVVTPAAAAQRASEIASGLAASFTLGTGQFCTKPGLVFLPEDEAGDRLLEAVAEAVKAMAPGAMLTERIAAAFNDGADALRRLPGVRTVAAGRGAQDGGGEGVGAWPATPVVLEATREAFLAPGSPLAEECFGPVTVVVRYNDLGNLLLLLQRLEPALAAAVHAEPAEAGFAGPVLEALAEKAGRLIWNGYPTGVAVSWAMHHGGPWPATTNPLHTSVGAAAIRRWLRPICFQDVPEDLLPLVLQEEPPHQELVPRRVDGRLVASA
jgi:NADP-dependent aldehyde dehydrogenase